MTGGYFKAAFIQQSGVKMNMDIDLCAEGKQLLVESF